MFIYPISLKIRGEYDDYIKELEAKYVCEATPPTLFGFVSFPAIT